MIIGTGIDLCNTARIANLLADFGARFEQRCFTAQEQQQAATKSASVAARFYAKRFAAKEACAKALGCGIGQHASWQDIEIYSAAGGQPHITLTGKALAHLQTRCPTGHSPIVHLSLSDDGDNAMAMVVIETQQDKHP